MRTFTIWEPISKDLLRSLAALNNFGLEVNGLGDGRWPREDYHAVSPVYPIFAVADGVTLETGPDGKYPNPSGAGEVARIFCNEVVKSAESLYQNFTADDLKKIFEVANQAVGKYNTAQGRTKNKLNFWDVDLFAATGAFAVVKEGTVYWASMCDSFAAHFDSSGNLKLKSPECWSLPRREKLPSGWADIALDERKKIIRRVYRNGLGEAGELTGYGVITGEKAVVKYLNTGSFTPAEGELVMLLTDGFEYYLELPVFVDLCKRWTGDLEVQVRRFTAEKALDDPRNFGLERTLVSICF